MNITLVEKYLISFLIIETILFGFYLYFVTENETVEDTIKDQKIFESDLLNRNN